MPEQRPVHPVRLRNAGRVKSSLSLDARDDLGAVERGRQRPTRVAAGSQHGQDLVLRDGPEAGPHEIVGDFGPLRRVADVAHDAEVDGVGALAARYAVPGKAVLVRVSYCVVCLGARAGDAGAGREEDEEVEVLWE